MNVLIYGKPGCPSCSKSVQFCNQNNISYSYHTVGVDITKEQLLEKVGKPVRSVPQIFINEGDGFFEHVGGYEDFVEKMK